MIELIWYVIIGLVAGFAIGYLFARSKASSPAESDSALAVQVAELKAEIKTVEEGRKKLEEEREKSVAELKKLEEKNAEEREKRLKEWMDSTQKFFEEQGKSREELDKKRDAMMLDMNRQIASFTRTVTGTTTRGQTGESILQEALSESIRAGLVSTDLETGNGVVEFAWNIGNGRYIPIDSKFPDLFEDVEAYSVTDDPKEQRDLKKRIAKKIQTEVKRFTKYLNQSKTVETGIIVVPEAALDIEPSIVSQAHQERVFVCSYRNVIPIAYTLEKHYLKIEDDGDLGVYREVTDLLFSIFEKIDGKLDTVDRGLKMASKARDEIGDHIDSARREHTALSNREER